TCLGDHTVDAEYPGRADQIGLATRLQTVFGALSRLDRGSHQPGIGADAQGVGVFLEAAGQGDEGTRTVAFGKWLGSPGRRQAGLVRLNPDLEDLGGFVLQVVLAVSDTGTGAHHLHVAGLGTALVAQVVLMADGPFAYVGDDLHVAMRMRRKARVRGDLVVIPDAQAPPVHSLGV